MEDKAFLNEIMQKRKARLQTILSGKLILTNELCNQMQRSLKFLPLDRIKSDKSTLFNVRDGAFTRLQKGKSAQTLAFLLEIISGRNLTYLDVEKEITEMKSLGNHVFGLGRKEAHFRNIARFGQEALSFYLRFGHITEFAGSEHLGFFYGDSLPADKTSDSKFHQEHVFFYRGQAMAIVEAYDDDTEKEDRLFLSFYPVSFDILEYHE